MKYSVILLIFMITTGCSPRWINKEYQIPQDGSIADVKFKALDSYRNNDTIEIGLLSQESCNKKPSYSVVARLVTKRCFFDCSDTEKQYYTTNKLPSDVVLNFNLYNNSDSGAYVTQCNNLKSYKFKPNKNYIMEVNNWSTEGSTHSGFGCGFNVYEINASGTKNILQPTKPTLLSCANKSNN